MTLFSMTTRAMSAQMVRMNAATSNLANAGSVSTTEDDLVSHRFFAQVSTSAEEYAILVSNMG